MGYGIRNCINHEIENEVKIREKLIELRTKAGMTQKELAEKMGVTQHAIARLESGFKPSLGVFRRLCIALKCDANWLLEIEKKKENKMGKFKEYLINLSNQEENKNWKNKEYLIHLSRICIETREDLPKEPFIGQSFIVEEECKRLIWNGTEWIEIESKI